MKVKQIICGLVLTGAVIGTGSAGLGAMTRKAAQNKNMQSESFHISEKVMDKACKNAMDALNLKAQYQKAYLLTATSIKKQSIKI